MRDNAFIPADKIKRFLQVSWIASLLVLFWHGSLDFGNYHPESIDQPSISVRKSHQKLRQGPYTSDNIDRSIPFNEVPRDKTKQLGLSPIEAEEAEYWAKFRETSDYQQKEYVEFERQEKVAIVSKIHGSRHLTHHFQQSMCLLKYAYNKRVNYDIVVFSSEPVPEEEIEMVRNITSPAKFTFIVDNPGLPQMIANMTDDQKTSLLWRCGLDKIEDLDWFTECKAHYPTDDVSTIAYNWQAEFRSLHVWNQPALKDYRYMFWFDADGYSTRPWDRDPVAMFLQNNLTLLFDNFPSGYSRGADFEEKYRKVFNGETICSIKLVDGHLQGELSSPSKKCEHEINTVHQVHGFFHISDLAFYRSPRVQYWLKTLVGDLKFSRRYDDQLAVTVPAAIWRPNASWHMEQNGFRPDICHNKRMDGRSNRRYPYKGGFGGDMWKLNVSKTLPEAVGKCTINAFH